MSNIQTVTRVIMISLVLFPFILKAEQPGEKNDGKAEIQDKRPVVIEDIFKDILQTLPSNVKADLDSLKKGQTKETKSTVKKVDTEKIAEQINQDKRMKDLPENIRKQVEQAIQDIEKNREERELQFKEMQKKKKE